MKGKIIKLKNGIDEFIVLDKVIVNSNTMYLVKNRETMFISTISPTIISEVKY